MKKYKAPLVYNCLSNCLFSVVNTVSVLTFDIVHNHVFYYNKGFFIDNDGYFGVFLVFIWLFCMHNCVAAVVIFFVYRYTVVCEASVRFPGGVFGIGGLLEALNLATFSLLFVMFDNDNQFTYHRLLQANGIDLPFGVSFHVVNGTTRIYRVHITTILFQIIVNSSVMAYCAKQSWNTLQITKVRMGLTTLTFHSQIHKILCYMSSYLLFIFFVPGGLRFFEAKFLDQPSAQIGILTSLFSSMLPLVNAWMMIFLVPSFRRSALPVVKKTFFPRDGMPDTVLTVTENKT